MLKQKFTVPALLALVLIVAFNNDEDEIKIIKSKLEKFRKNCLQEKVHLQSDKPYYSIGDTIYFTAYVVNAEKNTPTVTSNILYIDLINDSSNIINTLKLPVNDGIAFGSFTLSDSLREGNYRVRAYTNWMRNFDDAFFFDEVIGIGNGFNNTLVTSSSFSKNNDSVLIQYTSLNNLNTANKEVAYNFTINKKEKINSKAFTDANGVLRVDLSNTHLQPKQVAALTTHIKLDDKTTITKHININMPAAQHFIQFFPEGGQMVAGFTARIGFKATLANGLGANVSGEIKDDSSNEALHFKSGFAGIGSFIFTPQSNHTYHAFIQYEDGTAEKVSLPATDAHGYVLSANNINADTLAVHINTNEAVNKVTLVAQTNNRMQLAAPVDLIDGNADISLSKKKFQTGILQLTLFDSLLRPVAERLAFINHNDALHVHLSLDKTNYSKREKTKLQLNVTNENGEPVSGVFSLAVTNASTVISNSAKRQSILSNVLLTSDIKGYVENANHYFDTINATTTKELDDLLLTQSWRRFLWKDILADKYPAVDFEQEKSLSVSGKVLDVKGNAISGKQVTLLNKKGNSFISDTTTDNNGNFIFTDLNFNDDNPFVLNTSNLNNDVAVKLNDFHPPPAINNKNEPEMQQASYNIMLPYLTHSIQQYDSLRKYGLLQTAHRLKDVVVTTKQQTLVQQAVAPSYNLNGPGNADQILTYADLDNCHDLSICLQGKLLGVYFKMVVEDPSAHTKVWHLLPFSTSGMGKPMMVSLDGIYLTAEQRTLDMRNIPVRNIQSIEVLRSGGFLNVYGINGSGGVLVITTKQGGIDYNAAKRPQTNPLQNTVFTTAKGYSSYREFYMPDYSNLNNTLLPDLRSTIFWKPVIKTDDNGNATVEWFNADNTGSCNIVIEGLSADGKMAHASFTYQVK